MTDEDKKLLTRIYQDSRVGALGCEEVLKRCTNPAFKEIISNQMKEYNSIAKECLQIANNHKTKLPDNSFFKKMKQIVMINFSLLFKETDRRIAEMMITGTVMGIIDAIKALYDLDKADKTILEIGKKHQALQEKYVESLKAFLEG